MEIARACTIIAALCALALCLFVGVAGGEYEELGEVVGVCVSGVFWVGLVAGMVAAPLLLLFGPALFTGDDLDY